MAIVVLSSPLTKLVEHPVDQKVGWGEGEGEGEGGREITIGEVKCINEKLEMINTEHYVHQNELL